ncbi:hypothetical protein GV791_14900 [Nocardia cyriacigeorgica]|uniref:Tail assembly chaperone n=1 Tax=Nocardia cyriacigeorgica TaxID=135487 RepID=A0A6P1CR34_9NOCA|nr:hypothetical protein [Nocardia cyriacigeorgica]NEW33844.1 hypothetical protein [Nocardia cyriacigeorgica]
MPTSQNRTTRRATTKRAAAKDKDRAEAIERFDDFRRRAASVGVTKKSGGELVLGAEHGFEPPITARWPESLAARTKLDIATEYGDIGTTLRILIGPAQLLRVAEMFDPLPDADALLTGLTMYIIEKFLGPGAGDVPGGTQASST